MNIPTIPYTSNAKLINAQFRVIETSLLDKLDWLDYAFGKCQKLSVKNGKDELVKYPAIYSNAQSKDYFPLFPDERIGNFSFFVVDDPYEIEPQANSLQKITANYGLIFWFNLYNIYSTNNFRLLEWVKAEVLRALNTTRMSSGRIQTTAIHEEFDNIYNEFTISEINAQYLMQPFAGLRFDGILTFYESCS